MSWFSLLHSEKVLWDSQELVSNVLKGTILKTWISEKIITDSKIYTVPRDITASIFARKITPSLTPISKDFAGKLLERVVRDPRFEALIPEIFERFHKIGQIKKPELSANLALIPRSHCDPEPIPSNPDYLPPEGVRKLVLYFFDNYVVEEAIDLTQHLKSSLYCHKSFSSLIQLAVITSLRPVSEKIVHASMAAFTRKTLTTTIDFACKKIINVVTGSLIYSVFLKTMNWLSESYDNNGLINHSIDHIIQFLPSPSSLVWIVSAAHIAAMVKVILDTKTAEHKTYDADKDEVKQVVFEMTKSLIVDGLNEAKLFRGLNLQPSHVKIETLAKWLSEEATGMFWKDAHRIKILDIPLVT